MNTYHCEWQIEVDADTREEAARLADKYMREQANSAAWNVVDQDGDRVTIEVPIIESEAASVSHWYNFDDYPVEDWQYEVANGDTRLGYLEWAEHQREADEQETSS